MDAVKFIEERKRLCKTYVGCSGCPANDNNDRCKLSLTVGDEAAKQVELLEEWSAAHPCKTRQSVFLEQFPNIELDRNGIINISPCKVDPKQYPFNGKNCRKFQRCGECLREFWMQEVE